ncbi:pyridoxal-phosphate dependent enzyme, partial [Patulibacter sp. S7RM1-6]
AMAARAGLRCVVLVPARADDALLRPLLALGARVLRVHDPIDVVIAALAGLGDDAGFSFCSTARAANAHQAEAPRTIAYELAEQLDEVPDWVVVPVGGGGTLAGIHRGYRDLLEAGRVDRVPRLLGVVAADYDGLRVAFEAGTDDIGSVVDHDRERPPTLLGKIEHVEPLDGAEALQALRASDGHVVGVTDPEAVAAVQDLAAGEGLPADMTTAVRCP